MTIDVEGPPSVDFDFSLALEEWAIKNRRILKSGHDQLLVVRESYS
ncbi:unnamed protein product [Pocillopora meandrina]|uniref:Uncharacterized protein n=1 Tax=Pocillopora meandrina TaxID=46732 RepID=A0AAU9W9T2_9CNID|nr:unnamed protein product [Pocillopora meandrina]